MRMPALFIGHGSPMNAIENNEFVTGWEKTAAEILVPKAIVSVSAHWYTKGTKVTANEAPETIYDMYGFPDELYRVVYPAKGAPSLSENVNRRVGFSSLDSSWGYDHGTWSVLRRMYPKADIPVIQLSVDRDLSMQEYFNIGETISALRDEGVMIFGSGNVVHHLGRVNWNMPGGYSWADEFDGYIKENIVSGKMDSVINYKNAGSSAGLSVPTKDHFAPLLYVLGAAGTSKPKVFNEKSIMGSLSMTSYVFE